MLPMTEGLALAAMFTLWLVARLARTHAPAQRPLDPIALARVLASQGTATGAIARQVRLPHDVVTLTVHLTRVPRSGKKMPLPASSSPLRQKMTS